jgi:hypothetical protein
MAANHEIVFQGKLRESYHLRAESQADALALLERANLCGFVLPPKNGWVPIYVEGAPFNDNRSILQSTEHPVLHFFPLPGSVWTLRLFIRNKPVGDFAARESGAVMDRSWRKRFVDESLSPTSEERVLLDRLCKAGPPADPSGASEPLTPEAIMDFFGLPDGWLNYREIAEANGIDCGLPAGTRHFRPSLPPPACNPDPTLLADGAFAFPKVCFGEHATVTRAMRKLARALQKSADPRAMLDGLERVPFRELGDEILFGCQSLITSGHIPAWRPYTIGKAIFKASNPPLSELNSSVLQTISTGMTQFWFALGFLGDPDLRSQWMTTPIDRSAKLQILRGFVSWIPHLFAAAPLLTNYPAGQWTPRFPPWSGNIISCAGWAGWKLSQRDLEVTYAGDFCRAMLETGMIERAGDGFRVTEQFAAGAT